MRKNEQFETLVVSTGVVMVPSTGSGTVASSVVEPVETTEGTTFNKI